VTIGRVVPNVRSRCQTETCDFFVGLLGFEVAMDMGWVVTVASPTNPSAQVTIVGNDDMAAPGISVEVDDVDAVHARAVEQDVEIAYSLRDEEWGSDASCFASQAAPSSTSCLIARTERPARAHSPRRHESGG
jgi:Glyoxalase/Bleomycin resistance protein/Dioxygenase superfamily